MLEGFDPQLLLVLNLAGTFAFGVSGALAGVRARLDLLLPADAGAALRHRPAGADTIRGFGQRGGR